MDREAALRRLRACWHLSKSANANEAATALRQAQALMAEFGLSETDADADAVRGVDAATRSRGGDLPTHVWNLAYWVGAAFDCYALQDYFDFDKTVVKFIGRGSAPEIAAYSFDVLRRQMERGASRQVARCRKRKSKVERAEAYGMGFVEAIRLTLGLRDLAEGNRRQAKDWVEARGGRITTTALESKSYRFSDRLAGLRDGASAQLNPGVNGSATRQLEQHP